MMSPDQRDDIVDDLLRKTPKKLYDNETLFRMALHSDIDVQAYLLNRFFGGKSKHTLGRKKATLTRRTRRLWERLRESIFQTSRAGGGGIYEIKTGWGFLTLGYVYAASNKEALQLGELFLSYSGSSVGRSKASMSAVFKYIGEPIDLLKFNI